MNRNAFMKKCSACGVFSLLSLTPPGKLVDTKPIKKLTDNRVKDPNREQIAKLLSYIALEMDDITKQNIFSKLGSECFYCTSAVKWIKNLPLPQLIEVVYNNKSSRWDRVEYRPENSILKETGRKVPCNCAYSQCQNPPKSLCNYCCKSFLQGLFGTLLNKKVTVTINESIIHGGKQCSATIKVS